MGSIDVKRLYLEGEKVEKKCPKCGDIVIWDLENDYLSYPDFNVEEPSETTMYCTNCDTEIPVKYKLTVNFQLVDDND